jgi:hypothetical protein
MMTFRISARHRPPLRDAADASDIFDKPSVMYDSLRSTTAIEESARSGRPSDGQSVPLISNAPGVSWSGISGRREVGKVPEAM